MGIFDKFKKKENNPEYLYTEEELEVVDSFICDIFGEYKNVFHEIASPDIHLDVCIVEPNEKDPFYKLVTMGAGAYRMNVPREWDEYHLNYAEYVIYLPKEWNISSQLEEDYWPIRLLKSTARLPINNDTWLAYGHTTQYDEDGLPYASNTRFNSCVLKGASDKEGDIRLLMPSKKIINFYEIIPLYPEELMYKLDNYAAGIFSKFEEKGIEYKIVDLERRSLIES